MVKVNHYMKNEAVEALFSEVKDLLKYANHRHLSGSEAIDITILQEVLLITDAPIVDNCFIVDSPLFDLFRTARIEDFGDVKSIELISFPESVLEVSKVESFTNMLYDRLKNLTVGQGKFNELDQAQLEKGDWLGKLWIDYASSSVISVKQESGFILFSVISHP